MLNVPRSNLSKTIPYIKEDKYVNLDRWIWRFALIMCIIIIFILFSTYLFIFLQLINWNSVKALFLEAYGNSSVSKVYFSSPYAIISSLIILVPYIFCFISTAIPPFLSIIPWNQVLTILFSLVTLLCLSKDFMSKHVTYIKWIIGLFSKKKNGWFTKKNLYFVLKKRTEIYKHICDLIIEYITKNWGRILILILFFVSTLIIILYMKYTCGTYVIILGIDIKVKQHFIFTINLFVFVFIYNILWKWFLKKKLTIEDFYLFNKKVIDKMNVIDLIFRNIIFYFIISYYIYYLLIVIFFIFITLILGIIILIKCINIKLALYGQPPAPSGASQLLKSSLEITGCLPIAVLVGITGLGNLMFNSEAFPIEAATAFYEEFTETYYDGRVRGKSNKRMNILHLAPQGYNLNPDAPREVKEAILKSPILSIVYNLRLYTPYHFSGQPFYCEGVFKRGDIIGCVGRIGNDYIIATDKIGSNPRNNFVVSHHDFRKMENWNTRASTIQDLRNNFKIDLINDFGRSINIANIENIVVYTRLEEFVTEAIYDNKVKTLYRVPRPSGYYSDLRPEYWNVEPLTFAYEYLRTHYPNDFYGDEEKTNLMNRFKDAASKRIQNYQQKSDFPITERECQDLLKQIVTKDIERLCWIFESTLEYNDPENFFIYKKKDGVTKFGVYISEAPINQLPLNDLHVIRQDIIEQLKSLQNGLNLPTPMLLLLIHGITAEFIELSRLRSRPPNLTSILDPDNSSIYLNLQGDLKLLLKQNYQFINPDDLGSIYKISLHMIYDKDAELT